MAGSVGVMKTEAESPPSEDEAVFDAKPVTFTQVRLIFFPFFLCGCLGFVVISVTYTFVLFAKNLAQL
jgi:hypothetical protein